MNTATKGKHMSPRETQNPFGPLAEMIADLVVAKIEARGRRLMTLAESAKYLGPVAKLAARRDRIRPDRMCSRGTKPTAVGSDGVGSLDSGAERQRVEWSARVNDDVDGMGPAL
jgi:hypothetical protein